MEGVFQPNYVFNDSDTCLLGPHYFAYAHRQLLSEHMWHSTATKSLGKYLKELGLYESELPPEVVRKILRQVDIILQAPKDHDSGIIKVYSMSLEAVYHAVRYSKNAAEIFVRELADNQGLRGRINLIIRDLFDGGIFIGRRIDECVLKLGMQTFLETFWMNTLLVS